MKNLLKNTLLIGSLLSAPQIDAKPLNLKDTLLNIEKTNMVPSQNFTFEGNIQLSLPKAPVWVPYNGMSSALAGKYFQYNWNEIGKSQQNLLRQILGKDINSKKLYISIQNKDLLIFEKNETLLPRPQLTALDKVYLNKKVNNIAGNATVSYKAFDAKNKVFSKLITLPNTNYSIHDGRFSPHAPKTVFNQNNIPNFLISKTIFNNNWQTTKPGTQKIQKPEDYMSINIFAPQQEFDIFNNKTITLENALTKLSGSYPVVNILKGINPEAQKKAVAQKRGQAGKSNQARHVQTVKKKAEAARKAKLEQQRKAAAEAKRKKLEQQRKAAAKKIQMPKYGMSPL